jgi:hypothetical protein
MDDSPPTGKQQSDSQRGAIDQVNTTSVGEKLNRRFSNSLNIFVHEVVVTLRIPFIKTLIKIF